MLTVSSRCPLGDAFPGVERSSRLLSPNIGSAIVELASVFGCIIPSVSRNRDGVTVITASLFVPEVASKPLRRMLHASGMGRRLVLVLVSLSLSVSIFDGGNLDGSAHRLRGNSGGIASACITRSILLELRVLTMTLEGDHLYFIATYIRVSSNLNPISCTTLIIRKSTSKSTAKYHQP